MYPHDEEPEVEFSARPNLRWRMMLLLIPFAGIVLVAGFAVYVAIRAATQDPAETRAGADVAPAPAPEPPPARPPFAGLPPDFPLPVARGAYPIRFARPEDLDIVWVSREGGVTFNGETVTSPQVLAATPPAQWPPNLGNLATAVKPVGRDEGPAMSADFGVVWADRAVVLAFEGALPLEVLQNAVATLEAHQVRAYTLARNGAVTGAVTVVPAPLIADDGAPASTTALSEVWQVAKGLR